VVLGVIELGSITVVRLVEWLSLTHSLTLILILMIEQQLLKLASISGFIQIYGHCEGVGKCQSELTFMDAISGLIWIVHTTTQQETESDKHAHSQQDEIHGRRS
jgi:hypothetical protein